MQYELYDNTVTEIPLYAAKEGQLIRDLEVVATLTIGIGDGKAIFVFTPANLLIAALTYGFTGSITTYSSGLRYGYNSYTDALSGYTSAPSSGTGSLSGHTVFWGMTL